MPRRSHSLGRVLRAGVAAAGLCGAVLVGPVCAQDTGRAAPSVLTINQERLFRTTLFGQRLQSELNTARSELIAENARIQEGLEAEEAELTAQRETMEPAAFRDLADAFDEKVTEIRAEQEAKTRSLQRRQERSQQVFSSAIGPVVREVLEERGASVILDSRAILLAVADVDVTDVVRARVDAILGDGGTLAVPADEAEDAPQETDEVPFSTGEPVEEETAPAE
ncbi:OmpH family outer membrane protein [Vannielia litorea]|uniref:OmpH family outer membrane protein n=1 Tax=Vannielia litorea TaxID=1217970 RepID=UPI001C98D232|nr:OmpH family outer membrane protein [Vannielia litorea]MBY6047385.1 OmpH family outer membrane protein [Vannielia litorea]MBY6074799.1 OmpH family outer membrane protein [Vannielia litorea]